MLWINPANWSESNSEIESIKALAFHFKEPLEHLSFQECKLEREWKDLKLMVKHFYSGVKGKQLWNNIFVYRKKEFPNVSLIAELVLCIGVSNSVVEGGFSHLTCMLSDKRLSLNHNTMENLLMIKINNKVWSESEKNGIIDV